MGRLLLGTALIFAVAGLSLAFLHRQTDVADGDYFDVQLPANDLGLVDPGDSYVTIIVKNRSGQDRRILGISQTCTRNCCYGQVENKATILVKAGQTYDLKMKIHVAGSGPFYAPIHFYLEDRTTRLVEFPICGVGREQ